MDDAADAKVKAAWARIEDWLAENAPTIRAQLKPGATETELKNLQTALDVALPSDMLASYRIHNGALRAEVPVELAGWGEFLDVDGIGQEWAQAKHWINANFQSDEGAKSPTGAVSESVRRVPLTRYDADIGDYLCVDLAPNKTGTVGQIIQINAHDDFVDVIAPDFTRLLEQWADDLENDEYSVSALHGLVPAESWDAEKQTWKNPDLLNRPSQTNPKTPLWKRLGNVLKIG